MQTAGTASAINGVLDQIQQAKSRPQAESLQALASYALERREQDGWEMDRLTPLLAGLAELLPWLKQWHNEVDPHSGERMGDYFESFLSEQLRELDLTPKALSDWRTAQKAAAALKARKSKT